MCKHAMLQKDFNTGIPGLINEFGKNILTPGLINELGRTIIMIQDHYYTKMNHYKI